MCLLETPWDPLRRGLAFSKHLDAVTQVRGVRGTDAYLEPGHSVTELKTLEDDLLYQIFKYSTHSPQLSKSPFLSSPPPYRGVLTTGRCMGLGPWSGNRFWGTRSMSLTLSKSRSICSRTQTGGRNTRSGLSVSKKPWKRIRHCLSVRRVPREDRKGNSAECKERTSVDISCVCRALYSSHRSLLTGVP